MGNFIGRDPDLSYFEMPETMFVMLSIMFWIRLRIVSNAVLKVSTSLSMEPFSFRSENAEERNNAAEAAKQIFDVIQNDLKHDVTPFFSHKFSTSPRVHCHFIMIL